MKIVVLSSHTPSLFWFRMDMMQTFIEEGHEVFALGNEPVGKWKEKFSERKINYNQINVQRNSINPLNDLKTLVSIRKSLKDIKPDKIFSFQAKTVIYGGIAANSLGIKEVYPLIAGMGSVFISETLKSRIVRTILAIEYKVAMRRCPVIFFQNHDDERMFRENKILHKQKIVFLHGSGVNTEHFQVQPLPERSAFLCISRLIRDKGVYEYLEACRKVKQKYPEVRCLLVGPYDSNPSALKPEELQSFIDEKIIEYYGEQEDVRPYLAQSNVFVLPSYREGTPKTVLEAMASGRAVITTDAPGCRETVVDGKNGFMVPIKNVDALCDKMEYLMNNPEVVSAMAIDGREKAEKIFDVKLVNQCICETMGLM